MLTHAPYGTAVDVWSLGCVAYELEVGRAPFFHLKPEETQRLITQVAMWLGRYVGGYVGPV